LNFKIAVAQVPSLRGDIEANIETHIRAIKAASQSGVSYIVFPELSLTGRPKQNGKESVHFASGNPGGTEA
jgi:predicted amidohydrolase